MTRRSLPRSPTWPRRTERSVRTTPRDRAARPTPGRIPQSAIEDADAMTAVTQGRSRRSLPTRLVGVVGVMLVVVVVSQVASQLRSTGAPARQAPPAADPLQPALGDLDAGPIS